MAERGVLTAPAEVWDAAVRQAEVIGPLAEKGRVGLANADEVAAMLGITRRQVYVPLGRWCAGEGVVSDLLPGRSSGGRGARRKQQGSSLGEIAAKNGIPKTSLQRYLIGWDAAYEPAGVR
ncbi:hypothetical protein [Streptacidiphilus anmyonensis]|uniref:hypothetical protein n=1 Tax=Streptacidiphilus anmyonensis TaxID=405782 RepID=UPI000A63C2C4|nr:hypothetical protein [Streptacidiphilus anmyonensis]